MSIQLTISLLASNRRESLVRCLDSLRPLLMQVPSELIIVLTAEAGSEQIYEIAGLYTGQIVPFTWCNDFSAARNAGLKAAKGEWFLFIDDDEWFEDVSEICDFFTSGEYRRFHSASYIQRNYLNWDGIHYSDIHVLRMARIVPGIHFEKPIHESLTPVNAPCKYFHTYVHHYGYAGNRGKADSVKPFRNIPLLLQDVEAHPSNIKNYLQLVQEYTAVKDWKKAEEYCRKGRGICKKQPSPPAYRHWLQVHLITVLYEKGDPQSARQEALSILKTENPCELVRLILYSDLILINFRQAEEPADIVELGILFEQLLSYMDKNRHLWEQQRYGDLNEQAVRNPDKLFRSRLSCVEAALKLEEQEKGLFFLKLLPWEEEYQMQQFYPLFDTWKDCYHPIFRELLGTLPLSAPYLTLQKLPNIKENEKKEALLLQCAEDTESVYVQMQIIKEALQIGTGLSDIADTMDLDTWKQCTAGLVRDIPVRDMGKIETASETLKEKFLLHKLWLTKLRLEKILTHAHYLPWELPEIFTAYCDTTIGFYKEQYQSRMFDGHMQNCLPQEYQFAVCVSQAIKKYEKKEFLEAIRLLCSAVHHNPSMVGVTNEMIRLLKGEMNNPAYHADEEFRTLAIQLKNALTGLIERGMYTEALSVLPQLVSLLPEDLEILRIKQKLLKELSL